MAFPSLLEEDQKPDEQKTCWVLAMRSSKGDFFFCVNISKSQMKNHVFWHLALKINNVERMSLARPCSSHSIWQLLHFEHFKSQFRIECPALWFKSYSILLMRRCLCRCLSSIINISLLVSSYFCRLNIKTSPDKCLIRSCLYLAAFFSPSTDYPKFDMFWFQKERESPCMFCFPASSKALGNALITGGSLWLINLPEDSVMLCIGNLRNTCSPTTSFCLEKRSYTPMACGRLWLEQRYKGRMSDANLQSLYQLWLCSVQNTVKIIHTLL